MYFMNFMNFMNFILADGGFEELKINLKLV